MKAIKIAFTLVLIIILTIVGTASAEEKWIVMPMEETYILLQEDGSLSPQLYPDTHNQYLVEAEYIEEPITGYRTQRDWVDVGSWTFTMEAPLNVSDEGAFFLFWYNEVDEGYDNDPDFELTYVLGDMTTTTVINVMNSYPVTEPESVVIDIEFDAVNLEPDDTIEIHLRYRGYEDMEFHYGSSYFNSGLMATTDALRFYKMTATRSSITLVMTDHFNIDWSLNQACCIVVINKDALGELLRIENYNFGMSITFETNITEFGFNISFKATLMTWDHSFDDGEFTVYAFHQYNNFSHAHIGWKHFKFSGSGEEDGMDLIAIGIGLVLIAVVAAVVYFKYYIPRMYEEAEVIETEDHSP